VKHKRKEPTQGAPSLTVSGSVATIRFERPEEHNRIDPDDIPVIRGHLERVAATADVRVVVFTGAGGKTFSSGFTIDAILDRLDKSFEELLDAVEQFPLPTIAALNGGVYGGATDLALACDIRIGVGSTRMFMPAARFGLHYYPGGLRRYVAALGLAEAKRIFLTGQTLGAKEMLRIGFLTELVPNGRLDATVGDYVAALETCDLAVVRSMKRQLNAIAAGDSERALSREEYEASLHSAELRRRLEALSAKPKRSGRSRSVRS
jgi:enoyl-CoA hydratase/carnithine racemase